jgi:hypothetical protein
MFICRPSRNRPIPRIAQVSTLDVLTSGFLCALSGERILARAGAHLAIWATAHGECLTTWPAPAPQVTAACELEGGGGRLLLAAEDGLLVAIPGDRTPAATRPYVDLGLKAVTCLCPLADGRVAGAGGGRLVILTSNLEVSVGVDLPLGSLEGLWPLSLQRLAVWLAGRPLRIFEAKTGQLIQEISLGGRSASPPSLVPLPDGSFVVSTARGTARWRAVGTGGGEDPCVWHQENLPVLAGCTVKARLEDGSFLAERPLGSYDREQGTYLAPPHLGFLRLIGRRVLREGAEGRFVALSSGLVASWDSPTSAVRLVDLGQGKHRRRS